jgi:polyisoprenoid-binding protein YceI
MKGLFAGPLAILMAVNAAAAQSAKAPKPTVPSRVRYVVAPAGNEARYRVREQLAGFDLPNDAVGITKQITGRVVFEPNGKVNKDSSRIVVAVGDLKSDKTRRDNYLKTHTLESMKFPQVELVPVTFDGLATPIPAGTTRTFSLIANLTVRGVTHPTTWKVTAHADGADVVGSAATAFTFKDFALDQPRVPVVLSVEDTIKLEYDFRFAAETKP